MYRLQTILIDYIVVIDVYHYKKVKITKDPNSYTLRSDYKSNYLNSGGISPTKQHSCWVYGPYLFMLPTTRRPTRASNREINQKLLTLLGQPACLTALHRNGRTGCSLGFLRTASQSEAII